MRISPRLLGDDEHVVVATRTHVKALLRPAFLLIVICAIAGFVLPWVPDDPPLLVWLVWALTAVAIGRWVVWPFVNWLSESYTLTNRRLITRHGVFTRFGHDIPLHRVHDVSYEHGFVDRVLGCGTLVVSAASERGQVVLPDVPNVEHLYLQINDLLMGDPYDQDRRGHRDEPPYETGQRW